MTDDVSKLPAWPVKPTQITFSSESLSYALADRHAYRARMEALVKLLRKVRKSIPSGRVMANEIDALLAACARDES